MTHRFPRGARLAAAAVACAAWLAAPAQAQQSWNFSQPLTDFSTWTLRGDARAENQTPGNGFTYSTLQLTQPGSGDQAGAGWAPSALQLDVNQAFRFDFTWFIPTSTELRGDGFTLALSAGGAEVGGGGSGLGYEGIDSRSIAFAVDTFHFDGEPVSPSLQILGGGSVTPLAATETGLGDAIRNPDFQWFGSLSYTPSGQSDATGTLVGEITHIDLGSFQVSAPIDFAARDMAGVPLWVGFTASNGLATDGHFITSAVPVPEPGPSALLAAGLAALAWRLRRERATAAAA